MAKRSRSQKVARVNAFLYGLEIPEIAAVLATRGFGPREREEGQRLVQEVAKTEGAVAREPARDRSDEKAIDAWENTWFPVAEACLARHFPKVRDKVFLRLRQTKGPVVCLSVGVLLERLRELAARTDPESSAAMQLLRERGLTDDVLAEGERLVKAFQTFVAPLPIDPEASRASHEAAVTQMWSWYLEWSGIARTVIHDRTQLRALGFLASSRRTDQKKEG